MSSKSKDKEKHHRKKKEHSSSSSHHHHHHTSGGRRGSASPDPWKQIEVQKERFGLRETDDSALLQKAIVCFFADGSEYFTKMTACAMSTLLNRTPGLSVGLLTHDKETRGKVLAQLPQKQVYRVMCELTSSGGGDREDHHLGTVWNPTQFKLDLLKFFASGKFDTVFWMDSDTVVFRSMLGFLMEFLRSDALLFLTEDLCMTDPLFVRGWKSKHGRDTFVPQACFFGVKREISVQFFAQWKRAWSEWISPEPFRRWPDPNPLFPASAFCCEQYALGTTMKRLAKALGYDLGSDPGKPTLILKFGRERIAVTTTPLPVDHSTAPAAIIESQPMHPTEVLRRDYSYSTESTSTAYTTDEYTNFVGGEGGAFHVHIRGGRFIGRNADGKLIWIAPDGTIYETIEGSVLGADLVFLSSGSSSYAVGKWSSSSYVSSSYGAGRDVGGFFWRSISASSRAGAEGELRAIAFPTGGTGDSRWTEYGGDGGARFETEHREREIQHREVQTHGGTEHVVGGGKGSGTYEGPGWRYARPPNVSVPAYVNIDVFGDCFYHTYGQFFYHVLPSLIQMSEAKNTVL